jgi:hypothetical protein
VVCIFRNLGATKLSVVLSYCQVCYWALKRVNKSIETVGCIVYIEPIVTVTVELWANQIGVICSLARGGLAHSVVTPRGARLWPIYQGRATWGCVGGVTPPKKVKKGGPTCGEGALACWNCKIFKKWRISSLKILEISGKKLFCERFQAQILEYTPPPTGNRLIQIYWYINRS